VFSLDTHLKNYGVMDERVVLLDTGGLTNRWSDIEERLKSQHEFLSPHAGLGLEMTLRDRPDIASGLTRGGERWSIWLRCAAAGRARRELNVSVTRGHTCGVVGRRLGVALG